jgi:hypothetical protein
MMTFLQRRGYAVLVVLRGYIIDYLVGVRAHQEQPAEPVSFQSVSAYVILAGAEKTNAVAPGNVVLGDQVVIGAEEENGITIDGILLNSKAVAVSQRQVSQISAGNGLARLAVEISYRLSVYYIGLTDGIVEAVATGALDIKSPPDLLKAVGIKHIARGIAHYYSPLTVVETVASNVVPVGVKDLQPSV